MVFVTEKSLNAAFEKLDDRKLGYITHEDFLTGKLIKISHEHFLSSFSMLTYNHRTLKFAFFEGTEALSVFLHFNPIILTLPRTSFFLFYWPRFADGLIDEYA
jgi:hypothetical protein